MNYLEIIVICIVGWTAGAESGSWSCVHPVIKTLDPDSEIRFQKGLLKTFGRVMPVLMPLQFILVIILASLTSDKSSATFYLRITAMILLATMIATTVIFNVPVNVQTGKWTGGNDEKWKRKRKRWRFFQGYRSIILIIAFILLVAAQTF